MWPLGKWHGSKRTFIVLLTAFLSNQVMAQTQPARAEPWRQWNNVSQLQSGRRVRIETIQSNQKLNVRFVSSDDSGVTVHHADGKSETIARSNVRKILARRESMKYAPLIGAAAGGSVFAVFAAKLGEDLVPSGKALFVGVGVGIGALGGWAVGTLGRYKLIYEAPRP